MTTLGNLGVDFTDAELAIIAGSIMRGERSKLSPTMDSLRHFTAAYAIKCVRNELPLLNDAGFEIATLMISRVRKAAARFELESGGASEEPPRTREFADPIAAHRMDAADVGDDEDEAD